MDPRVKKHDCGKEAEGRKGDVLENGMTQYDLLMLCRPQKQAKESED
jgi:hypothetical protein